jgi:hypothetical protein
MFRFASQFLLTFGLLSLVAFQPTANISDDRALPYNSTLIEQLKPFSEYLPETIEEADTTSKLRVLMLNYSTYGNPYSEKVRRSIERQMPACTVSDFGDTPADDLAAALSEIEAVVVAYPVGKTTPHDIKTYGKSLMAFARQGGVVILTGTHEFEALQQFGLFELDFGYFCKEPTIHPVAPEHALLQGITNDFLLTNFAYPLDISDPNFVTLADVRGYPVVGYKAIGSGKVIYLGIEYYYDEPKSAQLLYNALRSAAKPKVLATTSTAPITSADGRVAKRSEEVLYAGGASDRADVLDLKVYPNPYFSKANLDIELSKPTQMSVEVTDEAGRIVAVLLPRKNLSAGFYRLELPNLPPGIYFVKCQNGAKTTVRKVVKAIAD